MRLWSKWRRSPLDTTAWDQDIERSDVGFRSPKTGVKRSGKKILTDVCINQDDLVERAQQVPLMGDVYGFAEEVVIWLGEAHCFSRIATPQSEHVWGVISLSMEKVLKFLLPVFLEQAQTPLHKIPHCCLGEFSGFEALHL
jgi:hypothetical protein